MVIFEDMECFYLVAFQTEKSVQGSKFDRSPQPGTGKHTVESVGEAGVIEELFEVLPLGLRKSRPPFELVRFIIGEMVLPYLAEYFTVTGRLFVEVFFGEPQARRTRKI